MTERDDSNEGFFDCSGASMREHPEVSDFIAYLRLKNLSPQSIVEYEKVLNGLFDHIDLGDSSPKEITTAQLRDYVASMEQRGLAAKTVSNHVLVIKRFFGFLLAEGCIEEDPSLRIPRPKVGKRLPRALTVPQVQALFMAMSDETPAGHRDQVFFKLLYACGLRVGEAVQVRVADINWEEGWLRVIGKGNKERRVYLEPYLVEALREYIEENEVQGYLFSGRDRQGHIRCPPTNRRLKRYVEKAGLPGHVSPHTLRHSGAAHYLIGGAPITFVQNLLGHESPSTGPWSSGTCPGPFVLGPKDQGRQVQGPRTEGSGQAWPAQGSTPNWWIRWPRRLRRELSRTIVLNTKTAIDEIEATEEGKLLKEARGLYEIEFEGWDDSVGQVLEWL